MGNSNLIDITYLMLLLVFSAGNIICNFSKEMFLLEQNKKNPLEYYYSARRVQMTKHCNTYLHLKMSQEC